MNKTQLIGNLVSDVEFKQSASGTGVARLRLAVRRNFKNQQNEYESDFINCVAFGRSGEFAEKYLHKGTKIAVTGRIQTGSYTNKEGVKVYTTEVVVEDHEFAESRNASGNDGNSFNGGYSHGGAASASGAGDGFMNIPDGIDEELPFN